MSSKWLIKQQLREKEEREQALLLSDVLPPEEEIIEPEAPPSRPESLYTWVEGDLVWEVARRMNLDPLELLEHNDIEDYNTITPGTVLHLPYSRQIKTARPIRYEVFDDMKPMHVNTIEGTRKVSFGHVAQWSDLKEVGKIYPADHPLLIAALAHVPIGDTEMAAYYMDAHALGDYVTSGRVAYTIGFNHSHLSEGHVELPMPGQEVVTVIDVQSETETEAPLQSELTNPNEWKATYKPLREDRKPVTYVFDDGKRTLQFVVKDIGGVRPPKFIPWQTLVAIGGTFEKDGVEYFRPHDAVLAGRWFGIKKDIVVEYNELYNAQVSLPERVAMGNRGKLTPKERYMQVPLYRGASRMKRLSVKYKSIKNKRRIL